MDPAHGVGSTRRGHKRIAGLASTLLGACAAVVVLAMPALAALPSTTVNPSGDAFTASLHPGTTADFVASVTVSCNVSATSGQVPVAPGNHNGAGPVTIPLTAPTFTNNPAPCSTSVFFTTATTTTSGAWSIAVQFLSPGSATGTLNIPQHGVVVQTSGLASCTVTVAPNGPTTVTGTLSPGNATTSPVTLPTLAFANAAVPISVTGSVGCPTTATSGMFSATYDIADTTHPSQLFTVTS